MPFKIVKNKKTTMKTIFTLVPLCIAMTACVYNEDIANAINPYTEKHETTLSYSMTTSVNGTETPDSRSIPDEEFAQVSIRIQNLMPDLNLIVEGIRLCNIHLSGTYHFATEEQESFWETDSLGTVTIETGQLDLAPNEKISYPFEGSIPFIPQTTKAWHPYALPQHNNGSYILLKCKIFNQVTIWSDGKGNCAEAAIPLSVNFQSNQPNVITLTLEPDCPWYNIKGSTPQPLLVPITFVVSVDDWSE